jgi:hypothetical protein
LSGGGERQDVGGGERRDVGGKKQNSSFTEFLRPHVELALGRGFDDNVGRNAVTPIFEVHLWAGGGLIDFDDVSVVVEDGFWSGCRGQFLICNSTINLTHKISTSRILLDFYVQCLFCFALLPLVRPGF